MKKLALLTGGALAAAVAALALAGYWTVALLGFATYYFWYPV